MYVTFPLVREKNLLLKILLETKKAIANLINSILQYEYLYKRISLDKNPKENFKTFIKKCAPRYLITKEEIDKIEELFEIIELHNKSPMEFTREEKIVIMSENSSVKTISIEKTKEFLNIGKSLLKKTKDTIGRIN